MERHAPYLRRCIELSLRAREKGNMPFGSLLAVDGRIVLEGENTNSSEGHPFGHSEMNVLREACQRLSPGELQRAALYTAVEPCLMCCGAMLHSGVRHLVFGCTTKALLERTQPYPFIESQRVFELLGVSVTLEWLDMEAEVLKAHEGFWNS